MKRLSILLILIILFIPTLVYAEPLTPSVDSSEKIYDYADLLTDEEEKDLKIKIDEYINKNNLDLVLVTIDKNPYGVSDEFTQTYAQDFYDYNDFGIGSTYDGVLVLIDMDNRYPYIVTTGQAILLYDDNRIDIIHNLAYDYLASGEYYNAFYSYVDSIGDYADEGIPNSNQYYCIDENGTPFKCKSAPKKVDWGLSLMLGFIIALASLLIHLSKYKGIRLATNANSYVDHVDRDPDVDKFLTTFTSRVKINHDSHIGSGRGGGGSSISFGSSGRAHGGGGGRHF